MTDQEIFENIEEIRHELENYLSPGSDLSEYDKNFNTLSSKLSILNLLLRVNIVQEKVKKNMTQTNDDEE